MKSAVNTTIQPLTGTTTRMKSLPYAGVSGAENFNTLPEPLQRPVGNVETNRHEDEQAIRKCVYTYEDKYAFARIISGDSLIFDSHFESGNLHSAFRVFSQTETIGGDAIQYRKHVYELYMHNDLYTNGNTQWFYFRVSNVRAGQEVTFIIKNFQKPESLFNEGMRPLFFSTYGNRGWERCGLNIKYFPTTFAANSSGQAKSNAFSLTFTVTFEWSGDVCYFSCCLPYTYSDLQKYLQSLVLKTGPKIVIKRCQLCKTIGGNRCDLVTITAPAQSVEELNSRQMVVITARVHPGESNSSWIVQGILDFLTGDDSAAVELRNIYVFKVVPMLNPDGVINGNYRCSLAGCDLNRKWSSPDANRHPTIFHTKRLLKRLSKYRTLAFVLDLHGHSRKKGIFVYGCLPDRRPTNSASPTIEASSEKKHIVAFNGGFRKSCSEQSNSTSVVRTCRYIPSKSEWTPVSYCDAAIGLAPCLCFPGQPSANFVWDTSLPTSNSTLRDMLSWKVNYLPRIFSCVVPTFSKQNCSFKMHKSKAGTMRIVAFAELGIDCVYTVEASLAGSQSNHYLAGDYLNLGKCLCFGLLLGFPCVSDRTIILGTLEAGVVHSLIDEAQLWRSRFESYPLSMGSAMMSEAARMEMIHGTDEQFTDDSDNDTVALERASMTAKKLPEKKKVDRKIGQEGCEQGRHRPAANICLDDGKRCKIPEQASVKASKPPRQKKQQRRYADINSKRVLALSVVGSRDGDINAKTNEVAGKELSNNSFEKTARKARELVTMQSDMFFVDCRGSKCVPNDAHVATSFDDTHTTEIVKRRMKAKKNFETSSNSSIVDSQFEAMSPFSRAHSKSGEDADDARAWSNVVNNYLDSLHIQDTNSADSDGTDLLLTNRNRAKARHRRSHSAGARSSLGTVNSTNVARALTGTPSHELDFIPGVSVTGWVQGARDGGIVVASEFEFFS